MGSDVRYWPLADIASCAANVRFLRQSGHDRLREIRFRGRYWGQSGHDLLRRTCLLLTQSGHPTRVD
jgi:hypothetical protein